ncbi:uncharacterized protein LOC113797617 isoform X2 [Dermatophagoides pteronyssinus]|uniref:uncharacterized protein LOC113797617 isoform X2 n=1 Tax=Dermatophagoides pteronyssinus TaxID=6956 RepID=UPI003F681A0A
MIKSAMQNLTKSNDNELEFCDNIDLSISIESIYESASEIGEHFKKLIQLFGAETFEILIPCIVRVLENLENVTVQRDNCLKLLEKLNKQIYDLQQDHQKRKNEQLKFQLEIEDIDELWRKENDLKPEKEIKIEKSAILHKNEIHNNTVQLDKLRTKIKILKNEIELKNEENVDLRKKLNNLDMENKNIRKIISSLLDNIICLNHGETSNNNENDVKWKEKIAILEEKLLIYKQQFESEHNDLIEIAIEKLQPSESDRIKMEDLPVQGPIPKEPDEKLFWSPRNNPNRNRIWSFFPKLSLNKLIK